MAKKFISCEITEYNCVSKKEFNEVTFMIDDNSLLISICNQKGEVLEQTEISIKDAKELSKLIQLT